MSYFSPKVSHLDNGNVEIEISYSEPVEKIVEKFNRRAAREGISERVEIISDVPAIREWSEEGREISIEIRVIEVSVPVLAKSGWKMVAALDFIESGVIVRAVPGESLEGWERPSELWCDHCERKRGRNRSFVVRSDEGEIKQVGSSCLGAFIGFSPSMAFFWLGFADEVSGAVEESSGHRGVDRVWSIESVIRTAYVISDGGKSYVRSRDFDRVPTSHGVSRVLAFTRGHGPHREEQEAEVADIRHRADEVPSEIVEEIIEFGKGLEGGSDYAVNMRVLLDGDHVGPRHVAILSSLVAVWAREMGIRAERKAAPVLNEWIEGEVKQRLRGLKVVVTKVVYIDGDYGLSSLVLFRDEEGRSCKWFASGAKDFEPGDELVIDGTIKGFDEYEGTKQTQFTRCTVKG